jgi:biotin carboxylase
MRQRRANEGSMGDGTERILCIASHEKGHDFLRQCAEMGVQPTLLTLDKLRDAPWPREAVEQVATMPGGLTRDQILNTVCWMARGRRFDRVVALDEHDLATAAALREHIRVPGMGVTTAAYHLDKLAMRTSARDSGFAVPAFCRVLKYDELRDYMARIAPPWMLKPRIHGSSLSARVLNDPEQLWRALDELGDQQSHYLLEQYSAGDVFHVEAIVSECDVLFSVVQKAGRAALPEHRGGGVFTSRTVDRGSRAWLELTAINAGLAPSFGMVRGVTHAEFVRAHADGRYYFLQIAARVAAAGIADVVEAASGVNLWREWARIEVAGLRGQTYVPPDSFEGHAGSVLCLASGAAPETAGFTAPEIVTRFGRNRHAGLILRSDDPGRVKQLVEDYAAQFARRLAATAAEETPTA